MGEVQNWVLGIKQYRRMFGEWALLPDKSVFDSQLSIPLSV